MHAGTRRAVLSYWQLAVEMATRGQAMGVPPGTLRHISQVAFWLGRIGIMSTLGPGHVVCFEYWFFYVYIYNIKWSKYCKDIK
jgi:hypothetical protein